MNRLPWRPPWRLYWLSRRLTLRRFRAGPKVFDYDELLVALTNERRRRAYARQGEAPPASGPAP